MDDADGELIEAFFTPRETSAAYLSLLDGVLRRRGIPLSVYQDCHSALKRNDKHWSLQEQLAGERQPTQVGMALKDLGIQPIFALSPQAKGRVERLFGTLQDRLLAEMRLDGITNIEAANSYLRDYWIERFNMRFRKQSASPEVCFRPTEGLDLNRILAFRYPATVGNDNAIRLKGKLIDIPPVLGGRTYARASVDVRQHLDGSWSVYHLDRLIASAPTSPFREPLVCRRKRKSARAGDELVLLYLPSPLTLEDIFARHLGGHIASA